MQARPALALAILFGSLAVILVAADVAYSLEAELQARLADGSWVVVSAAEGGAVPHPRGPHGCLGHVFQLWVENHRPIGARLDVEVGYYNATTGAVVVLERQAWDLVAFETRALAFEVPPGAFVSAAGAEPAPVSVFASTGDQFLAACAARGA